MPMLSFFFAENVGFDGSKTGCFLRAADVACRHVGSNAQL